MKNEKKPHFYIAIFWFLISITAFCSGATKPVRPYYSETPSPRHIQNNDRLTAEYFNNQLNVIYNWAQNLDHDFTEYLINNVPIASGAHYYGTVKDYMDSVASATYDRAKTYAEDQDTAVLQVLTALQNGVDVLGQQTSDNLGEAKDYADQQANNAYNNSTSYANNLASSTEEAFKKLATTTLDAAKGYANSNFSAINHDHDSRYITAVAQGDSNGQIKVTKNGTATNVSVKGLGSAAYTASTDYATANHNHNSAYVSAVATGDNNGTIKVTKNGSSSNVAVKGLGSAAYANVASFSSPTHNHNSSYVSAVAQGSSNGTIAVTKNGSTSNVSVKGLGSAAYTASTDYATANHTHTIDSAMSDSSTNPVQNKVVKAYVDSKQNTTQTASTPPNNPIPGQIYFDTGTNILKYWNGTSWIELKTVAPSSMFTASTVSYSISGDSQTCTEILWQPNNQGKQIVQYMGYADTGNDYVGIVRLTCKLDLSYPYTFVAVPCHYGTSYDSSVCLSVGTPDNSGDRTIFYYEVRDNDGSDTRQGKIYFFIQGIIQ